MTAVRHTDRDNLVSTAGAARRIVPPRARKPARRVVAGSFRAGAHRAEYPLARQTAAVAFYLIYGCTMVVDKFYALRASRPPSL